MSDPTRRPLEHSPLDAARHGLDLCVHCGFCLPACPTYLALEDENDSPRGRLVLMRALLDGDVAPTDAALRAHLDRCLGCRGCETACPSGVPYGHLLEASRATLLAHRPLPWVARLVLAVFAHEWLLRPALALARAIRDSGLARLAARVLPARIAMPAAMLASTAREPGAARPAATDASVSDAVDTGTGREPVTLLTGCVMEGLLTATNRATERVFEANGFRVLPTPGQVCCGALHAHAGDVETARRLARENIAAFEQSGATRIAMNSAGCGAMCKQYGALLGDDRRWAARARAFSARVVDAHELLAEVGPRATGARPQPTPVAWDAPCHLEHAQRVLRQPLAVLSANGAIRLRPLEANDQCCGSAGIFNLVQPEVSERVLAPKLAHIAASGAAVVATANPGCLMQIGGGLLRAGGAVVARHPLELLDAAYAEDAATR